MGSRASLDLLENKSFHPHWMSHRVFTVLQLKSLSLQRFRYGGLRIRARMENFITQIHSLATHLCSCVINFQLCGKKWQMQLKLKDSPGNRLDFLKITFSGIDFQQICMFIRFFFNSTLEHTRISLKNDFVGYCNLKYINVAIF